MATISSQKDMEIRVDKEVKAVYIKLNENKIDSTEQVAPGIICDFDRDNAAVGIEILSFGEDTLLAIEKGTANYDRSDRNTGNSNPRRH